MLHQGARSSITSVWVWLIMYVPLSTLLDLLAAALRKINIEYSGKLRGGCVYHYTAVQQVGLVWYRGWPFLECVRERESCVRECATYFTGLSFPPDFQTLLSIKLWPNALFSQLTAQPPSLTHGPANIWLCFVVPNDPTPIPHRPTAPRKILGNLFPRTVRQYCCRQLEQRGREESASCSQQTLRLLLCGHHIHDDSFSQFWISCPIITVHTRKEQDDNRRSWCRLICMCHVHAWWCVQAIIIGAAAFVVHLSRSNKSRFRSITPLTGCLFCGSFVVLFLTTDSG